MIARDTLTDGPAISWLNEKCRAYILWFNLYTFVVWALLLAEFFTKAKLATLPGGLMAIYLTFLTAYTGQKELARWKLGHNHKRLWGEIWVYIWLFTGLLVFGFNAFRPDFKTPTADLVTIISTTLVYFTGTEYSKKAYREKNPK
ncbi:MAG: hypothetical protein PHQ42_02940 [Patescibacteria group bacterium]|nr:hypothetical protein [Patescibacteria group bacterium]